MSTQSFNSNGELISPSKFMSPNVDTLKRKSKAKRLSSTLNLVNPASASGLLLLNVMRVLLCEGLAGPRILESMGWEGGGMAAALIRCCNGRALLGRT